jgi:hypothetical protein
VVSPFHPEVIELDEDVGEPVGRISKQNDKLNDFNRPRYRRTTIPKALSKSGNGILFEAHTQPCASSLSTRGPS